MPEKIIFTKKYITSTMLPYIKTKIKKANIEAI